MSFIEKNLNKSEKLDQVEKPSMKPAILFFLISISVLIYLVYHDLFGGPEIDRIKS